MNQPQIGSIVWQDLTVENAEEVRDFYNEVVGWQSESVKMGDYHDFSMSSGDAAVAGICHARGENAKLPPQWLIYITVDDLEYSIDRCQSLGGRVICPPRSMGSHGTMCVIQDPAGAVAALIAASKAT
jgi:predicted enzyme related to lactoylglutathione lyase